jgi:hypothetical protein
MIGHIFPEFFMIPQRDNHFNKKIPFFYPLTNRDKILCCGPQTNNHDPEKFDTPD